LILAFVLFSITIILVVRFVTLVLLMVIAPLGFAGLVVPGLEKTARDWWALLIREAMVAPALLLVLYVALAVITDKGFLSALGASGGTGGAGYSAIANGGSAQSLAGYAGILLAFLIAMGLLTACVIVAKRMGAIGASAATKWAGAATFGVTGWAVRNSAGRLGAYAGRGIRRIAPNEIGRTLANPFDRLSKASFSVASTGIGKGLGIELGKGQKGGYAQEVADKKKAQLDYAKSLGARDQTKEEKERVAERQAASEAAGTERDVAAQTKRQKELELAELKKREDPNNFDAVLDDKIRAAKKEVEESSETLAAANTKLATANSAAAATKKEVDDATSAKGVQQQYKANLESGSNRFITTAGGIAGGAAGGAWLGAEFGLVGGPLGVAIGSSIGAGLGAWLGKRQAWRSSASAQAASSIKSGKLASGNKAELEELLEKIEKDAKDKAGKGEDE
ncbi:MAG: hypothetical protein ACREGR_04590, partial [Minisyncoccia bacterium]